MSAELHVLANGLTVAVDPLPGAQSVALGALCDGRLALRARASERPRACRRAYGVQGRRLARHAGARRGDRGCRRRSSTPGPRATRRSSTAATLAKDAPLLAELIADFVRAPHLDEEHLEREKDGDPVRARRSHRFARRPGPRPSVRSGVRRAAARPLGPRPRPRPSRAITREDCLDWIRDELVPSRLILVGERQGRSGRCSSSSPSGCSATWRLAGRRRSAVPSSPAACATTAASSSRRTGASAFRACRVRPAAAGAVAVRPGARRRNVVAPVPGAARGARPRLFGRRLEPGLCRHRHRRIELRRRPRPRRRIDAPCARGARRRGRDARATPRSSAPARSSRPGC